MAENRMERFVQAAVLLVGLLVLAVVKSESFMGCLLTGAALLVVFNLRSLSDEQSKGTLVMQGCLSLVFALLSESFFSYLIFYELRMKKRNRLRVIFPGLFYLVGTAASSITGSFTGMNSDGREQDVLRFDQWQNLLPYCILNLLLLTVCAFFIFALETWFLRYFLIQRETTVSVRSAAVKELNEKKLNHELVIRQYLTEQNARLEERENISRNIHNSVGHTITAAVMTLDAAELLMEVDTGKAKERVGTAKERMKEGLNSIRCAVRVLDKEASSVLMEDFLQELSAVTETFVMDTRLEIRTDISIPAEAPELPNVHTEFLTGAVQELLTNGVKHGGATRFLLSVVADSAHLQVSVKDNGTGDFSEKNKEQKIAEGYGLKKIVSYVKRCGGSARFTNENGFCAVLTLPLVQEEKEDEL